MNMVFNEARSDRAFNLDAVAYEEMFEGLKENLALALSEFEKVEIKAEDLILGLRNCFKRSSFGEDKNLYTKIKLDIHAKKIDNYMIIFNPFEIYMTKYDGSEERFTSSALDKALTNFMVERFPDSKYLEKREKYFKDGELIKKVDEILTII